MENTATADGLIQLLTNRSRVITLGGVAVISHGLNRNTHDADIWLDPAGSIVDWTSKVGPVIFSFRSARPVRIGTWAPFAETDFATVIGDDKVIRVIGLDRPLDIFREPNELEVSEFDDVWNRATPLDDGTRVPDVIDLLVTKQATGRDKDVQDIAFLEAKAEREYLTRLLAASAEEAAFMLGRFLTPRVAEAGLHHTEESVRQLSLGYLKELAEEGDPFARDILAQ